MSLKLFISYSHQDQDLLTQLLTVLEPLKQDGLIEPWTDRLIFAGEDWKAGIDDALQGCDLGLFLVSHEFLGSNFIHAQELKPLLERAGNGQVKLFPILLRECGFEHSPLGHLQPLPGWDRTIETPGGDDKASRAHAWKQVQTALRQWAQQHNDESFEPVWQGPPYPGLRAFDEKEAPIFTGRADTTAALVKKLEAGVRFLAVFGASGSGKSSLLRAGLLPAWRQKLAVGDKLPVLIVKPDEDADGNPFTPLANALQPWLGPEWNRPKLKQALLKDPASIRKHIEACLKNRHEKAEFLLVVDQFEELFTTVLEDHRQPFASLLEQVLAHPKARLLLTVRSDFFHCFEDYPALTERLNESNGRFQLLPLGPEHYRRLIEEPARLAGFRFQEGLVERLLQDAEAGSSREGLVPLLQFALAKLYQPFGERLDRNETLTVEQRWFDAQGYAAFGGIKGAVGAAADEAAGDMEDKAQVLHRLFRALVSMNAERKPTRRRAQRAKFENDPEVAVLLQKLVGDQDHARLLVAQDGYVEVAHEILFEAWADMAKWIVEFRQDLQLRDRMVYESDQWDKGGRSDPHLLWSDERQQPLYLSLERLGQPFADWTEEPERSFLRPEAERLLDEIHDPATSHQRRDWIGARWAAIGDPRRGVGLRHFGQCQPPFEKAGQGGIDCQTVEEIPPNPPFSKGGTAPPLQRGEPHPSLQEGVPASGLPDILWSEEIGPGEVELEGGAGRFLIAQPYKLAVHLLTRDQYLAFLNDPKGYDDDGWWQDLEKPDPRWPPTGAGGNYPVGLVTWYEAVAYCRWLDARLHENGELEPGQQIRLPTEWEWQWAAAGGGLDREFPWGAFDAACLNNIDSGLMRNTAVGLYPEGAAACGCMDMAGNSWEWCLNKHGKPGETGIGGKDVRVLRGGSWINFRNSCRADVRLRSSPDYRSSYLGFRLCLCRLPS